MFPTRLRSIVGRRLGVLPSLMLAGTLLPGTLGTAVPALAEQADPDVRILVEIKKVIVHDDMDWGDGDIGIDVQVRTDDRGCQAGGCDRLLVESSFPEFHASDGETEQLNRFVPRFGDYYVDPQVSPDIGIPIHFGQRHRLIVRGSEIDTITDDDLGTVTTSILDDIGQIRFGTHLERSVGGCVRTPSPTNFCDFPDQGAFSVEYEILEAQLPDLRPVDIKVLDLPGSPQKLVCAAIQNAGVRNAGPFALTIQVDGVTPTGGRVQAGGMPSGQAGDLCAQLTLPTGQRRLTAIVDEARTVVEVRETNNRFEEPYLVTRVSGSESPVSRPREGTLETGQTDPVVPATSSTPTGPTSRPVAAPAADVAQADLTVSAIKVNGQAPDGKRDCKDGKNTVVVVVKNGGPADAEGFVVRLTPGNDQGGALERPVSGLKAGQEQAVSFGDVRLMNDEQKLTATVDAKGAVAESNEENNGRTMTAVCQSAG